MTVWGQEAEGAREGIDLLILIRTDMDRNCSNALMELHWQSACPYWRSRIIDDTFLLVTLRDDSCARQNLFPHEAIFELPDTASVLSSCTSPLRSLKPYTNTHIQANLPNNSTPACLFKCGLSRIDTIVLFLPINVRLFFGETHSFRSPWHIFRLAVMHAVRHFTDLISKPCITSHSTGLLNSRSLKHEGCKQSLSSLCRVWTAWRHGLMVHGMTGGSNI